MNPVIYLLGSIPASPAIALNETAIVKPKITIMQTEMTHAMSSRVNYTIIGKIIVKIDVTKKQKKILCFRGTILKYLIEIA
jgi:hypothetical protein